MSDALAKPQTAAPISPVAAGAEQPKAELPNADDVLGAPPSADDILGPPPTIASGSMSEIGAVMGGPAADAYASQGGLGRVLGAFGQGVKDGWGTAPLGLDDGLNSGLKQAGIFNDVQKGQHSIIRSINEALIRPAAAAIDAAARAGSAVFSGAQAAVAQTGAELGAPNLARDIAAMPEAFFGQPGGLGMPHGIAEARSLRVIGEGEEGWKGTAEPAPVPESVLAATVKEHQEAAEQATGQPGVAAEGLPEPGAPAAAPAPPQDIHEAARQIAPDTFTEYDALQAHRDELRQQITEQQETLHQNAEAQAPHAAEIADLEHRLEDTTPRLAKKYEARLAEMRPEHDAFLADQDKMALLTRDTPEIAALRQEMLAADYRMRDLAPEVTTAYRQAAEHFPAAAEEIAPNANAGAVSEPIQAPEEITPAAAREAAPVEAPAAPEPATNIPRNIPGPLPETAAESVPGATPAAPALGPARAPVNIASDVSGKLVAAGRPAEEADAAGALWAAYYETRSKRFGGALGTAEEMYGRDAPDIVAGKIGGRKGAAAGKLQLPVREMAQGDAGSLRFQTRPIITLFDKADASTFIHETGHDWLERLMGDAADERAPAQLVADGKTVRDWLGAGEGDITTRQHEKFARGFEQYMREGRAPSAGLARVFAQFKEWLTRIYETINRLGKPITPDIRDVFDRFLTHGEPGEEPVIAPEPPGREFVSPVRRTPRGTSPYEKVPREPLRLTNFLRRSFVDENGMRRAGGLRDEGGDVSATVGGPKGRPGLINNETGQNLDDAARRAWEAGYFPEHGEERPDINALKDAIAEDVQGNPRYSEHDADDLAAYHVALGQNSEIDRLSAEHGIDPKGLTREQFFDKVAESEKAAREAIDLAEMQVATHNEVREDIQDWMEHHGETWDPEAVFGKPRTLEDLEAEDHQGDATPQPGRDEGGREQPVPADGSAGEGQGVGGPGGRGAGAASGAGTEGGARPDNATTGTRSTTERPAGPNIPFERADTDLIDKAGNIRLDNLNQPESVNEVIRDTAFEGGDFTSARRGVISDAQVLDLADALGMDAKTLDQRQLGQAFNAEQVVAARKLLIQSATAVRDSMAKAASGTDADVMAYGEAKTRHQMIQEQVSGVTAEAGRALRAFRSLEGARDANAIGEFLQGAVGKTLFQLRAEAQLGMELETPQQISKFLQDSKKASFSDMLLEYWINGLISGPATHTTYAVGNALLAMWKAVPEAAATSAIGLVRHAITGEDVRVMPGEVGAQLYGMMKGVREGIFAGWKAAKTGLTTSLPGEETAAFALQYGPRGAIPGPIGTVVRLPSRGVAMIHSFFRSIGYSQAKAALAYRAAAAEGLAGDEFAARVAELSTNPSEAMMAQARAEATEQTLMGRGGEFTQTLAQLSNKPILGVPLFKFVMPFVKIGANVMSQGLLERSPLGFLDPEIRANLLGVNGPIARDTQWARVAVGTAVAGTAVGLAAQGLLTGGGPSDPKEAAIWRMTGKQPYSVRIGDTWYGIHRLGPLATILGVGADIHEFGDAVETKDASKIGGMLISSITKGLLDETWMRGPAELIQALEDPDRYGARYVRDQLSSFVPFSVGMSQMARAADPYSREARTMLDAVKNKVPFLSRTLLPRYDIWGQPMPNKDVLGVGGLSAIMESRVNNDPVNQTLLHLGIFPAQPERKIRGIELTDQQYEEFAKTAGRMTKMRLDALVGTPGFSALPDTVQSQVIRQTITTSRETARTLVMMRSAGGANDIIQQAVTNKAKLLQPTR